LNRNSAAKTASCVLRKDACAPHALGNVRRRCGPVPLILDGHGRRDQGRVVDRPRARRTACARDGAELAPAATPSRARRR